MTTYPFEIPKPIFSKQDHDSLHRLVFRDDYSGYKPSVIEIPNGDGKADSEKRYAHVGIKYLQTVNQWRTLKPYLEFAHAKAEEVGRALRLPPQFMPRIEYGALRILDYPPGAISNEHEDFDLFTLMCYRDQPDRFVTGPEIPTATLGIMRRYNEQAHVGQLGEELCLGPATPHQVLPSETRQHAIVYFAIPDHDAVLSASSARGQITVRDWLNERMARSRTAFKAYE